MLKLSFWTRGMPEWGSDEFARRAAALGYDGVDLRCDRPGEDGTRDPGQLRLAMTAGERSEVRETFAAAGVAISSLLCYSRGGHAGGVTDWDAQEAEFAAHAQLASELGAPRIRLTVGQPGPGGEWASYLARLWEATGRALDQVPGIGAVFENHPGSANAWQLLTLAKELSDDRIGVHFSPDHTLVMQEDTLGLIDEFLPQIHQVCFSDRRVVQEDLARFDGEYYYVRYEACWNGEGAVPARKIVSALTKGGYDGYFSLKWEKSATYGHNLPDGVLALEHFPGFVRSLEAGGEA